MGRTLLTPPMCHPGGPVIKPLGHPRDHRPKARDPADGLPHRHLGAQALVRGGARDPLEVLFLEGEGCLSAGRREGTGTHRKSLDELVPRVNPTREEESSKRGHSVRKACGPLADQPGPLSVSGGREGHCVVGARTSRSCAVLV